MAKIKLFKIKTIKDWEGEDWDVYEECKTPAGIILNKGWPYGMTPKNGGNSAFSFILSDDIAEYLQSRPVAEAMKGLAVSEYIVCKFRKIIGCHYIYPKSYPFEWMLEHQEDIIYLSFEVLEHKYGLSHAQVENYTRRLIMHGIVRRHHQRETVLEREKDQWFEAHKKQLLQLDRQGIQQTFNVKKTTATRLHNLVCEQKNIPTSAELYKQRWEDKKQWLLDHQEELLSTEKSLDELALKFGGDRLFIRECRVLLRRITQVSFTEYKRNWVLQHRHDLETLSMKELQQKLQRGPYAIRTYQRILLEWKQKEDNEL